MTAFRNPLLIVSSLVAGLGPLLGNAIYEGPTGTPGEILKTVRDPLPGVAYVTVPMELVGFLAMAVVFAWFAVYLVRTVPVVAVTTAVLGAVTLGVKLGSLASIATLELHPHLATRSTAALFEGVGETAFVLYVLLGGATFLAIGLGLARTELAGWRAWWAVGAGALSIVLGLLGAADYDLFVPVPFLLLNLWLVILPISLVGGRTGEKVVAPATSA